MSSSRNVPLRYIETDSHKRPDHRLLIIQAEDTVEIVVDGYGTGEAELTVKAIGERGYEKDIQSVDWNSFVPAIVWAAPVTIAHLVLETLDSQ